MFNVTFAHAHDHAVVSLNGELDWDAAFALVDTIDTMVETYFYTAIEIVVSSPGGDTKALNYCLARLERLANERVRLRTRVLSFAASAAAVLVSSGEERIVEPGARLAWHGAQLRRAQEVDARETAALASALTAADDRLIDRLVSGALATSKGERPSHRAERSDRRVLELLAEAVRGKGGAKVPRKVRKLARAVGRVVDRAERDADRKALAKLYGRLFELDASVSAELAVTLRLVDRVGAARAQEPVRPGAGALTVPEWRALYPPDGTVPRGALTRHTLIFGETGSGKTASCILPVVAAMAAAPPERLGAALIIDPKRELGQVLNRIAPERLHHVTVEGAVLKIMAGPRWSLEDDLAERRWLSAARRILCRVASFLPNTPARVLMDHEVTNANTEFFDREGTSLALTILAFLLMLLDERTPAPETWLKHDVEAFTWADDLLKRARGPGGPNALALLAWVLDGPLMSSPSSRGGVVISIDTGETEHAPPPEWLFTRLARAALNHVCTAPGEGRDVCGRIVDYWTPMVDIDRQYAGVRATAAGVCSDFAAASVARSLYFGCEPGYHAARLDGSELDFAPLVAPDGPGTMVLFQPARDGQDALVAIALKAAFFEAVLDDPDRARGGAGLPLVGYVADEFHRFVTSDPLHGEQSFLDTCRSFSAFCVLACQSVASINHALAHGGGSYDLNHGAVGILWSNTATKLVFRSTDPEVADRVAHLSPHRPGLPGVVRVRPVSSLASGECYASLADGRFERRQLGRFRAEAALERGGAPLSPKLWCATAALLAEADQGAPGTSVDIGFEPLLLRWLGVEDEDAFAKAHGLGMAGALERDRGALGALAEAIERGAGSEAVRDLVSHAWASRAALLMGDLPRAAGPVVEALDRAIEGCPWPASRRRELFEAMAAASEALGDWRRAEDARQWLERLDREDALGYIAAQVLLILWCVTHDELLLSPERGLDPGIDPSPAGWARVRVAVEAGRHEDVPAPVRTFAAWSLGDGLEEYVLRISLERHAPLLPDSGAPVRPGAAAASVNGPTIAELADDYMTGHVAVHCKPGTERSVRAILDKHVLPEFGRLRLGEITPDRVAALHYRLHATPIMANQAVDVVSRLYNRAAASDDPPATGNPCRFIKKYPARSRERFLTEQQFARLGAVLDELAAAGRVSASARTAIRKILVGLPRTPGNPWVIPGSAPGRRLGNLNPSWELVREKAGLKDVRIHDLRHSFASRALARGHSLTMIGRLLGHRQPQTTARYAHLAPHSVKSAAESVADSLLADIFPAPEEPHVT